MSEFLSSGTVLHERFRIQEPLGRGGFSCAYLAEDQALRDLCVVKELFPSGAARDDIGVIRWQDDGPATHRLRQRFLEEAKLPTRVNAPGILRVRSVFTERGTAYFVTDTAHGAETLGDRTKRLHRLPADEVESVLMQLIATLRALHGAGILHRDIKPSNVLISPSGAAYLIDFGAAREWQADVTRTHTLLFTPAYAAPEQFSPTARRGPATDIYGLCAALYEALTGTPPAGAPDRASGVELARVRDLAPDAPLQLCAAVEYGLKLAYVERPQTVDQLLAALHHEHAVNRSGATLAAFDERMLRLKTIKFAKLECPACRGVLERPRPLKRLQCPVCRQGSIQERKIDERRCPNCRQAPLNRRSNDNPLVICPICAEGLLGVQKKGLFSKERLTVCNECDCAFETEGDRMTLVTFHGDEVPLSDRRSLTRPDWRHESGRSHVVFLCSGCGAQYDELADGRRKQRVPHRSGRYDMLFPDEWARVASGLPPNAGNADCDHCGADFFIEGDSITCLGADLDPFAYVERYQGRLVGIDHMRWLGVGKLSPNAGFVCADCGTELDEDGPNWRVVQSENTRLVARIHEAHSLDDWRRIGQDLPLSSEQEAFERDFDAAIVAAYESGQIDVDRSAVIWKGQATRLEPGDDAVVDHGEATLAIDRDHLAFGGLLKKWRVTLEAIQNVREVDGIVWLTIKDEPSEVGFEVRPLDMTAHVESGARTVPIGAAQLAARIRFERGFEPENR